MTRTATPQTVNALPVDPGDVCLCTMPNGSTRSVAVLCFRADGKADVRGIDARSDRLTVPIAWLTPLTH